YLGNYPVRRGAGGEFRAAPGGGGDLAGCCSARGSGEVEGLGRLRSEGHSLVLARVAELEARSRVRHRKGGEGAGRRGVEPPKRIELSTFSRRAISKLFEVHYRYEVDQVLRVPVLVV